ncbi:MAG: filamentous hemagglutinin N-terminal domain-containing protein [Desulfobacterales bacterium]|nr:filamentous hemagglutinin N-terminal domain-containing protein [Desulfobacterales bacterium]
MATKLFLATVLLLLYPHQTLALPSGSQVVSGRVSLAAQDNTLTITNSPEAIIHWRDFSINANEAVRFVQQNSASSVLNRITGGNPSRIFGLLESNGRVFLINPNGILFGPDSRIDVNGLVASTLDISDRDFLSGNLFFGNGPDSGFIDNQGTITTPDGGKVYLIAPDIENSGIIRSPAGEVLLAAGHSVQIVDADTPEIAVVVSAPEDRAVNLGGIVAQSGTVGIYGSLIAQSGIVSADSATVGTNGQIYFKASQGVTLDNASITSASGSNGGEITIESEAGDTLVSGTMTATGAHGQGGEIRILGNQVILTGRAMVDASGSSGGGRVLVGGDFQGADPDIRNAASATVAAGAVIKADALTVGDGGDVVIWSDGDTAFSGRISARGGDDGGNGGNVEVSGRRNLTYQGLADLRAPQGLAGTLLLDPTNFIVAPVDGDTTGAALGNQLDQGNVTIQTSDAWAEGEEPGDIIIADNINWAEPTTLFLSAHNDIEVRDKISNESGGSVVFRSDSDADGGGDLSFPFHSPGDWWVGLDTAAGGEATIYYNPPNGYAAPTDYISPGYFSGVVPISYMLVNNVNDLQNIDNNLDGTYALGTDIDASATRGWNPAGTGGFFGFDPIGTALITAPALFRGLFNGNEHTISNLYINRPESDYIGLFAGLEGDSGAAIRKVGLVDMDITGGDQTGGLVGNTGFDSEISESFTTGTISGNYDVGGLVGWNEGTINNCYSTAAVTGYEDVGGLVGNNQAYGSINDSYSIGPVNGASEVGGLVGAAGSGWTSHDPVTTDSYWDIQTSGQAASAQGQGKTTAEMLWDETTYDGWDPAIWNIVDGAYPILAWQGAAAAELPPTVPGQGGPGQAVITAANQSTSNDTANALDSTGEDRKNGNRKRQGGNQDNPGGSADTPYCN